MRPWSDSAQGRDWGLYLSRAAESDVSRRQFLRRGAVAVGALAGAGLFDVASAFGASGDPQPIPGGFDANFNLVPSDPFIHVLPPAVGFEMSTITDFNGVVGAGEAQGTANAGAFNFDADMRFMQGLFVDTDGRQRQGSFGFVWIDLFTPTGSGLGNQVHDFEPGIKPSGLFWTIPIDPAAIEVDARTGRARFHADDLPMPDFHDFSNAVSPSPKTVPGHVSFDVSWAGEGDRTKVRDTTFDFTGDYVTGPMTIAFSVSDDRKRAVYTADAAGQSNPGPPGVGRERNGVFFT